MLKPIQNVLMFMSILAPVSIYVYLFFTTEAGCTAVSLIEFIIIQSNFYGSNTFGTTKISSSQG